MEKEVKKKDVAKAYEKLTKEVLYGSEKKRERIRSSEAR